jgi:hypothetical protein
MSTAQSAIENLDLERLNDADKAEIRQFLSNQQQRTQIQSRKKHPFITTSRPNVKENEGRVA